MSARDPREEAALWLTLYRDLGVDAVSAPARPAPSRAAAPAPGVQPRLELAASGEGRALAALGAEPDRAAALERLRSEVIGDCRRCRLCEGRTNLVFGVGSAEARLMFVGEGPGADEDRQGEPFVGRAGQLLDKIIVAMGLTRAAVYIANIVKCRPPDNRTPLPDEATTCLPFLEAQIAIIKPAVIVALGKTALEWLVGDLKGGITQLRGRWFEHRGVPVMATFHPAYLLRSPAAKRPVWDDMQEVMRRLGLSRPGGA
jgi:DNA polymerase